MDFVLFFESWRGNMRELGFFEDVGGSRYNDRAGERSSFMFLAREVEVFVRFFIDKIR